MSDCDGHYAHYYEAQNECRACGHDKDEHDEDGYWADDRGKRRVPDPSWTEDAEGYVVAPLDWKGAK